MCNTNRVGQLNLTFISQSGSYDILCHITRSVCSRTVYLGTVLARKSSAAVPCISAVGIHNNFSSRESRITLRSPDDKTSCGIDEKFRLIIHHFFRQNLIKDLSLHIFVNLLLIHFRIVLCRQDYSFQTERLPVFIIFHADLRLAVRSQIRKNPILTHLRKSLGQLMSKRNRIRHILLRLICGIAKHHALVTCANRIQFLIRHIRFLCLQGLVHTKGNIFGLLINGRNDTAGARVKSIFGSRISDIRQSLPYDFLDIHIGIGCDLAHDHNESCCGTSLTCYPAHRVLF